MWKMLQRVLVLWERGWRLRTRLADIKADQKIRQMCRVIPTQSCRPLREVYSGDNTQA